MFLVNGLLLAMYFIFILDQGNCVRQKVNLSNFPIRAQNGPQAAETTHIISNALGPGTANEHTVQWWFEKFCKGDKSPEDEECSGWSSEVNNDQTTMVEADPLTAM